MNLNQQIKPFTGDGIPEYNRKFNEVIAAINYLLKIRTVNGKVLRDSDQGPVIDLAPAIGSVEPWLVDPEGNPAGWVEGNGGTNAGGYFYWGTGHIVTTTGAGNFVPATVTGGTSQAVQYQPRQALTHIPISGQLVFWVQTIPLGGTPFPPQSSPYLFSSWNGHAPQTPAPFNWTYKITYDGLVVYSDSGSHGTPPVDSGGSGLDFLIALNPNGWVNDPAGIPGYSQGSQVWLFEYFGTASTNPTPLITIVFTSSDPLVTVTINVNYYFYVNYLRQ